jgi:glutamine amidotransferase
MTIPVTVLDYGIGNQLNVLRALEHCGASVKVVQRA